MNEEENDAVRIAENERGFVTLIGLVRDCDTSAWDEGDVIYLFSDGFADQFGGPNNKKFFSKKFRELLLQVHKLPMQKQKESLIKAYEDWKGDCEQVDDILVIGIRI